MTSPFPSPSPRSQVALGNALVRAASLLRLLFWSRTTLKVVLWTITLIILFYAEENWRGARAWAATKAQWEAKGETLDYAKFIPPPIPDAQNLAAIPLFKLTLSEDGTYRAPFTLQKIVRVGFYPPTFQWAEGVRTDLTTLKKDILLAYAKQFPQQPALNNPLAEMDALCPFLAELHREAMTRPLCVFEYYNASDLPVGRNFGLVIGARNLARLLTARALLALEQKRPDLAFNDLQLIYRLMSGVQKYPSIVGGLFATDMSLLGNTVVQEGLLLHAWSDRQLTDLQKLLESVNFLAIYQFDMRAEAAAAVTLLNYYKAYSWTLSRDTWEFVYDQLGGERPFLMLGLRLFPVWPTGWIEQNKVRMISYDLQGLLNVDPQARRVFPDVSDNHDLPILKEAIGSWTVMPWNVISYLSASDFAAHHWPLQFSQAQVWLDEARIACGLEHYRLAHGTYPTSLSELTPAYLVNPHHDVISGEPYYYHLKADGTFALYSIGWNQKDDGGKVALKEYTFLPPIDYKQGDWPWPPTKPETPR